MAVTAIGVLDKDGAAATSYANSDPTTGAQQGIVTESAPASDTASSGINGRLQRIAQRLTSLIALFTDGTGTAAAALRVTVATDVGLPAGSSILGKVGIDQTTPGTTNAVALTAGTATNEIVGDAAHDAAAAGNPLLIGGYASATAPGAVSADGDVVRAWRLLNGSAATTLTAAGALIGGDATNGLDVDVTRMSALVAGSAVVGKVGIDQTTPGTTNLVALTSQGYGGTAVTFTPAAASHVANDCNGAAQTFTTMGPSAGEIMITSASLEIDGATAEVTAWRLHLYNVTPPSATADDGAWDLPSGDRASYLGFIELGTAIDMGSTQWVEVNGLNKQVRLAGTSLFGYLVNLTTLTPAAVAHKVTLHSVAV